MAFACVTTNWPLSRTVSTAWIPNTVPCPSVPATANAASGNGNVENAMFPRHGNPQLFQPAAEHLLFERGVGVHQPLFDRDLKEVRHGGQQIHFGL